jgi:hypothetical protein
MQVVSLLSIDLHFLLIMAKAKIKIVSVNRSFSREELDKFRRLMNCLTSCNLSVSIEFNEYSPIPVNDYLMPGEQFDKSKLKVKRNVHDHKNKSA